MWINAAILAGLVTMALPVVIHLVMRGRPRQMDFPALRFVRQSHLASAGRTRLKRWLLLALRAAMLGAFVLVLARPVDQSNVVAAYQNVPAAAVFCFDNSASMQYRHLGRSRLEMAQQLASRIVAGLPPGSRTAVLSLTTDATTVTLSDDAGQTADDIRRLTPSNRSESVAGMLRAAEWLLENKAGEDRREIYLLTDMTEGAWRGLDDGALAAYERVPVYVLDVAAEDNQNVALAPLDLSSRRLSINATLSIKASVSCGGRPAERTVVLEVDGQVRQRQTVQLERPHAVQTVTFTYQATAKGLLQGSVSLLEADPLKPDNQRFFTVEVGDPPAVAVVYGGTRSPRAGDAAFAVDQALAPTPLRLEGRASVEPELLPIADLASASLVGYEAVFLVDAAGVTDEAWRALEDFVARGGGLVVVAGPALAAELTAGSSTYNGPTARKLLGLRFAGLEQSPQGTHVEPPDYNDAALDGFDGGLGGDLTAPVIYRRLGMEPQGGRTVLKVGGKPLLVAGSYGQGNVLVLGTGPQSDWSALGSFRHANEFVVLMGSLLGQAVRQGGRAGRYEIGSPATFAFPRSMVGMDCVLSGPGLEGGLSRRIAPQTATAQLPALEQPGNYLLSVAMPTGPRRLGFSLNVDREESALKPRSEADVEKIFPKGLLHVARDLDGLQYAETLVRQGQERTAQIIPILMAIMVLELLVANRFYRGPAGRASPPQAAS